MIKKLPGLIQTEILPKLKSISGYGLMAFDGEIHYAQLIKLYSKVVPDIDLLWTDGRNRLALNALYLTCDNLMVSNYDLIHQGSRKLDFERVGKKN